MGDRVIDLAPSGVKEVAIDLFGTNDRLALLFGIGVILTVYAAVVGIVAIRKRLFLGAFGVAGFGAVGVAAGLASGRGVLAGLPSLAGATAGPPPLPLLRELSPGLPPSTPTHAVK